MLSIPCLHEVTFKINTMASLIESLWTEHEKPKRKYVLPDYQKHSLDTRVYHHNERDQNKISTSIILKSFNLSPNDFNCSINNNNNIKDWIETSADKTFKTITTPTKNNLNLKNHVNNKQINHKLTSDFNPLHFANQLIHYNNNPSDNVRIIRSTSDYMFPQCFFIHQMNPDRYFIAKVFPKTKKLAKARELKKEKKLWEKVSTNNNFLPLFGVMEIDNSICLLTENVPYISLKNLISGNKSLDESDVIDISAQLVLGLSYLHDNNILHRGLTPNSIFINWKGLIKISDLSTCEEKGKCLSILPSSNIKFSYCAPEVLLGSPYGIGSDWWSLGLIIYELLTGKMLLNTWDESVLCKKMIKENCKDILEDLIRLSSKLTDKLSDEAKILIKGLLERDDKKRLKWTRALGIEQITSQPFFSSVNWDNLKNCISGQRKVMMDLTLCSWYPDVIHIHQILGPDLGYLWGGCHLISNHKTGDKGMMKIIWKCKMRRNQNGWKQVMNERLVWSKMSTCSPYILPMVGFFETEATYAFVGQFIPSCVSLSCVIASCPLPENVIRLVVGQLAIALDSVHRQGILLRNLSPDSILIEASGRIWLTGFSWSKITKYSKTGHYEPEYMAPEVIQGLQYGKQSDWFALGIIIFQLITGLTPLSIYCTKKCLSEDSASTETLLRAMETIPKLLEDDSFSSAMKSLLKDMLTFEPDTRIGSGRNCLKRLKDHVFFKGLVWKKLEQAKEFS